MNLKPGEKNDGKGWNIFPVLDRGGDSMFKLSWRALASCSSSSNWDSVSDRQTEKGKN